MWVLMQSPMGSEDQRALTARERLNIQKQRSCWGRKGCLLGFAGVCEFRFYLLILVYFPLSHRKSVF